MKAQERRWLNKRIQMDSGRCPGCREKNGTWDEKVALVRCWTCGRRWLLAEFSPRTPPKLLAYQERRDAAVGSRS